MATGYLVTLGDGSLDAGDAIDASQSTFTIDQTIGTGGWTWSGVFEDDGNTYNDITDTGLYYLGSDGNVYFVPDNFNTTSGTASATSVPVYSEPDGTIDGTVGDDTIDGTFNDHQGETLSAGDDTIDAGFGDDTIDAGNGDDFVEGGQGADSILGGDGADTIFGDGGSANVAETTTLSWATQSDGDTALNDEDSVLGGFTGTSANGLIDIDLTIVAEANFNGATIEETDALFDFNSASDTSSIELFGGTAGTDQNAATMTLDFSSNAPGHISEEVSDVVFGIHDLDELVGQFVDQVIITAFDANGNPVAVTLTPGDATTITVDNATGTATAIGGSGGSGATNAQTGFLQINIAGPVAQIVIDYNNIDPAFGNHAIRVGDLQFDTIPIDDPSLNGDIIDGGLGDDEIFGGEGDDSITGGDGNDTVSGDDGDDIVGGGAGADILFGGDGNDAISGGSGNDVVSGDDGDDTVTLDSGNDTFGASGAQAGNDTVYGGSGADSINGGADNDELYGGSDDDTITGGTGDDTLYGGTGSDEFQITDDHDGDIIFGGEDGDDSDVDTIVFAEDASDQGVTVTATGDEAGTYDFNGTTGAGSYEQIEGFISQEGDDTFNLGADNSGVLVDSFSGDDSITTGAGDDTIFAGQGTDTINAGAGDDSIDLGQDSPGNPDQDPDVIVLEDGFGNDVVTNFDAPTPNNDGTFTGIDTIDVTNLLDANGDPVLTNDVVVSDDGSGNALLTFPNGETLLLDGIDAADADNPFFLNAIGIPMPDGTVEGTAGADTIDGSYTGDPDGDMVDAGDAILAGDTGDDDLIFGYGGNDSIFSGAGDDEVFGGAGNDLIESGSGDSTISGDSGDDNIDGGAGADTIDGGAGNDEIIGGAGDDVLSGDNLDNLITNGDFSANGAGWTVQDGEFNPENTYQGNGSTNRVTEVNGRANQTTVLEQDFTVSETGTATLSFDGVVRNNPLAEVGTDGYTVEVTDPSGTVIFTQTILPDSQIDWETYSFEIPVTTTGDYTLTFTEVGANDSHGALLDNVSVVIDAGDDTIEGGAGDDNIEGNAGDDLLYGGDDDDTLSGGLGDDTLFGDDGNDTLFGGADRDVIYGGPGDIVNGGGTGDDFDTLIVSDVDFIDYDTDPENGTVHFLDGGTLTFTDIENVIINNNDGTVSGTAGDDLIDAAYLGDPDGDQIDNADAILAGHAPNDDLVEAGAGNDTVFSSAGDDTVYGGTGDDLLSSGVGSDTVFGEAGEDLLFGDSDSDSLFGGTGNDIINGGTDADALFGGEDDDTFVIEAGFGDDTITGGEGGTDDDVIRSTQTVDTTTVLTGDEAGTITDGTSTATFTEIETINVFSGDDSVDASASDASITIIGNAGDDTLIGSTADDTIFAGADNDTINAGDGADTIFAGTGADTIVLDAGFGSDVIEGGEGGNDVDTLASTQDIDVIVTATGDEAGTITDGTSTATFSEIEVIQTEGGDDTIDLSADNAGMTVVSGAGNDSITGGFGDDRLDGGTGNDRINDGVGDDTVFGGAGDDTLGSSAGIASSGSDTLFGGAGDDTIYIGNGGDTAFGGDGADTFTSLGSDYSKIVEGGEGGDDDDTLSFFGETDAADTIDVTFSGDEAGVVDIRGNTVTFSEIENLVGTQGDDTIDASADSSGLGLDGARGADSITGGSGDDDIYGGAGDDTLAGGAGNDSIEGGTGNDQITGGAGDDAMFGGEGSDTFVLDEGFGTDTISAGENFDTADVDVIDAGGMTSDVTLDFTGPEAGTLSDGTNTATFTDVELVSLGSGNDTVIGGSGDELVFAGAGDDTMSGGTGQDTFFGGSGDDSITFAEGDNISGGSGDDTFTLEDLGEVENGTITIDGGAGDETGGDTLQLGSLTNLTQAVRDTFVDDGTGSFSGSVTLDDGTILNFSEIENIICFTPNTRIATPKGLVAIQDLEVGDMVVTRDHGLQPIRWIEGRTVPGMDRFAPVRISKNVLSGQDRDLIVSPQHRVLFQGYRAELLFGESEVLVAATHLVDGMDVTQDESEMVTYVHMLFDQHEIIYAEGAASESFHPGDIGFSAVGNAAREELFSIFPSLRVDPRTYGSTARRCLKSHEAKLIRT